LGIPQSEVPNEVYLTISRLGEMIFLLLKGIK
jgi:hypothetical protein